MTVQLNQTEQISLLYADICNLVVGFRRNRLDFYDRSLEITSDQ